LEQNRRVAAIQEVRAGVATGTDPGRTATVNSANPRWPSSSSAYRF
jgi:hypothetical protein